MKNFNIKFKKLFSLITLAFLIVGISAFAVGCSKSDTSSSSSSTSTESTYKVSAEEKAYLKEKFDGLKATNKDTIGYIYIPGTELEEPIVQTTDNATYLDKTFEGANVPQLGAVFMDYENKADFKDRLTWLFGHARGSQVSDHRMFNDVNFFEKQEYLDSHPYLVIETPERKYYYESMFLSVVPEDTEYYQVAFENDEAFTANLNGVRSLAKTNKPDVKVSANDKYLVLATCREDGETIRSLLYYRLIPDNEMEDFLAKNKDKVEYKKTR